MIKEESGFKCDVLCLNHNHIENRFLTENQMSCKEELICGKCSLKAVPMTLLGLSFAVPFLVKQITELKNDIFDLQAWYDEYD